MDALAQTFEERGDFKEVVVIVLNVSIIYCIRIMRQDLIFFKIQSSAFYFNN